jgi:hypothetical protein
MSLAKLAIKFFETDAFIPGYHVIKSFTSRGDILGEGLLIRMNGPPLVERFFGRNNIASG